MAGRTAQNAGGASGAVGADVGERVSDLLTQLARRGGDDVAALGEELVATLVGYYGAGLSRIIAIVGEDHPDAIHAMAADPLVESQLILHDLHPLDVSERIEAALDRVRPYLGSHAGGVAFLGVDDGGVAHLRLDGSCHNCASSTITVRTTITEALLAAAPELTDIDVAGQVAGGTLLQIGVGPGGKPLVGTPPAGTAPVWLHPSALELPDDGAVAAVHLDGRQVMMTRRGTAYYAYADACAACGESLVAGELRGDLLSCPSCGVRFDIRLAGRAADGTGRHLEPLPLLDDVSGIRIALQAEPA